MLSPAAGSRRAAGSRAGGRWPCSPTASLGTSTGERSSALPPPQHHQTPPGLSWSELSMGPEAGTEPGACCTSHTSPHIPHITQCLTHCPTSHTSPHIPHITPCLTNHPTSHTLPHIPHIAPRPSSGCCISREHKSMYIILFSFSHSISLFPLGNAG